MSPCLPVWLPIRYWQPFLIVVFLFGAAALPCQSWAQCTAGQATVVITVVEDYWADQETTWTLRDQNNNLLGSGTPEGTTICVPTTACLTFRIADSYGDGLDGGSQSADGSFTVTYNGTVVSSGQGNFGSEVIAQFGTCSAGSSCVFPITAVEGVYTAAYADTWYIFTPDTTGQFIFDACANTCNTSIWLYNNCAGINITDNQEGSFSYSSSGCGNQAQLTINLQAGNTYYIRIGDEGTNCGTNPINWSLIYDGPIVGCMNPSACNYSPLATVNDPSMCLFSGDPNCPDGPDLTVLQSVLASSIYYQTRNNTSSCYINEGCMNGYGTREIIRFTTHIKNIGNQDYFIGSPSSSSGQFEWDGCHGHYHYEGYAEYLLYDQDGAAIPIGFKNGFCVLDLECEDGGTAKYSCGNMGISAQCGDIYESSLNCQWIDITNVPAGIYTLVVRVNWDNSPDKLGRYETTISNNWAQVCIQITRNGSNTSVSVVSGCSPYVDCAGQIYGSAKIDCGGTCMGNAKAGDLNADTSYTNGDRVLYMAAVVQHNLATANCNDLNNDDTLTVTDPILLNACMHQLSGNHTDADDHCELPTYNVQNPTDTSWFRIVNYDPATQYLDVYLRSPMVHLLGYQFRISGIDILSVESLLPAAEYAVHSSFNALTGDIALFSTHEVPIPRYITPEPILRIYYAAPINDGEMVCLSNFTTVNDAYQETIGLQETCFTPYLNAQLQIWLEGAYNNTLGAMDTKLNDKDLLPSVQPFNIDPWNYTGFEAIGQIPVNMTDWVLVELRDSLGSTTIERRAALLMSDGTLRDVQGNQGVNFYTADRDTPYRLIVRPRNHLAVMTANTIQLPSALYNFALPANVVGGVDMLRPLAGGTTYGLIAGDIDANGIITVFDLNRYIAHLAEVNVYQSADCNLDGNVIVSDFNQLQVNTSAIGIWEVRY